MYWNRASGGNSFLPHRSDCVADLELTAATAVAGLAATFSTLGTPAPDIPKHLYFLAYSRVDGEPNVAYNDNDFRTIVGESMASSKR